MSHEHVDDDVLLDLADGFLSPDEAEAVRAAVRDCVACRSRLNDGERLARLFRHPLTQRYSTVARSVPTQAEIETIAQHSAQVEAEDRAAMRVLQQLRT